jgi:IS4 transposase
VKFRDLETGKRYIFLTNNFDLPALTIANLYKARWQIELFFKWIKQHLRITVFYGRSPNAVRTQIWIAISVYVLVAIVKKRLGTKLDLYTLLQILSTTLFQKVELQQAFSCPDYTNPSSPAANQLQLFNF